MQNKVHNARVNEQLSICVYCCAMKSLCFAVSTDLRATWCVAQSCVQQCGVYYTHCVAHCCVEPGATMHYAVSHVNRDFGNSQK